MFRRDDKIFIDNRLNGRLAKYQQVQKKIHLKKYGVHCLVNCDILKGWDRLIYLDIAVKLGHIRHRAIKWSI